jgi:hypothetical protein
MAELVVTLTGDEANLFRAQQKVLKQQMEMAAGYDDVGKRGKKSADDIADSHVKAFQKSQEAARKLDQSYKDQVKTLELQNVAMTKGKAAAIEMKAVQDGLTRAQAKRLGDLQRENDQIQANTTSAKSSSQFYENIVTSAVSLGAAYVGINAAAAAYTGNLQEQVALKKESLDLAVQTAKAQAGAVQNLTGLSSKDKAIALRESGELSAEVGIDRTEVEKALGAGYSAVGDIDATKNAVRAAAKITALTPEQLSTVTTGALDVRKGTGLDDAEANLSFLLQAGKQARIEDPAKLSATLAKALASGVNTVQGQDKQTASREIAAIFTELTQFATDKTGDSTATSVITLTGKLEEFFRDLQKNSDKLDEQIAPLVEKQKVTEVEQAQMARAELNVQEKQKAFDRQPANLDAKIDLQEAIARRNQLQESSGLSPEEQKKLDRLQSQRQGLGGIQDDGTVFGRLGALRSNQGAQEAFLENAGGEVAYQGAIRDLVTGGELSKRVEKNKGELGFDPGVFQTTVAELETLSPELRVAREKSRSDAAKAAESISGDKPTIGLINEITQDTLQTTRRRSLGGAVDYAQEGVQNTFRGDQQTAQEAAIFGVSNLEYRKSNIMAAEAPSAARDERIARIEAAIERILQINSDQQLGPTTAAVVGRNQQQADVVEAIKEQTKIMQQQAPGATNPANAIRNQAANPPVLGAN